MVDCLAADEGFEPSQTESESGVLPLHKSAKRKSYYTVFFAFVKQKIYFFYAKRKSGFVWLDFQGKNAYNQLVT